MTYELSIDELTSIGQAAKPPLRIRDLDDSFLGDFTVVEAGPPQAVLQHREGAFLVGRMEGDLITGWTFLEGDEAREAEREWCYRTDAEQVARAAASLVPGRGLDEAMIEAFGPDDYTAVELARTGRPGGDGGELRTVRVYPAGALLRVEAEPGGAVVGHSWLAGPEAMAELEVVRMLHFGFQGVRVEGPFAARTVSEGLAHARFRKSVPRFARKRRRTLEVFGSRGVERVAHVYTVASWTGGWSRGSFGEGTSTVFDPASLALWAISLEANAAGPRRSHDLALAAECCRQAAAFVPDGQDLPPLDLAWHTEAGRALRAEEPDRLSKRFLLDEAERLTGLSDE